MPRSLSRKIPDSAAPAALCISRVARCSLLHLVPGPPPADSPLDEVTYSLPKCSAKSVQSPKFHDEWLETVKSFHEKSKRNVGGQCRSYREDDPLLAERVERLMTVPAVGPITAL